MTIVHRALAGAAIVLALAAAGSNGVRGIRSTHGGVSSRARDIESEADNVTAMELAGWIRSRKPGLRVLDVRSDSEFAAYHIPSAERLPFSQLATLSPRDGETLVLYSGGGADAAQARALLRAHRNVYFLRGGLRDWMEDVLSPALPPISTPARDSLAALSRYFGGVPRDAASIASESLTTAERVAKRRRRGC
jgi:rhodanese-related sulfurtransferase